MWKVVTDSGDACQVLVAWCTASPTVWYSTCTVDWCTVALHSNVIPPLERELRLATPRVAPKSHDTRTPGNVSRSARKLDWVTHIYASSHSSRRRVLMCAWAANGSSMSSTVR